MYVYLNSKIIKRIFFVCEMLKRRFSLFGFLGYKKLSNAFDDDSPSSTDSAAVKDLNNNDETNFFENSEGNFFQPLLASFSNKKKYHCPTSLLSRDVLQDQEKQKQQERVCEFILKNMKHVVSDAAYNGKKECSFEMDKLLAIAYFKFDEDQLNEGCQTCFPGCLVILETLHYDGKNSFAINISWA